MHTRPEEFLEKTAITTIVTVPNLWVKKDINATLANNSSLLIKSSLTGKDPDAGKDSRQKEKRAAEDEMVG